MLRYRLSKIWDDGIDIEKKAYHRTLTPFDPPIARIIDFFQNLFQDMLDGKWSHYDMEQFTKFGIFFSIHK